MPPHERELTTSGLLADIGHGDGTAELPADALVSFDEILQRFSRRAFGVLVLIATLPAFLPLPAGAGAISGPLVALLGAQMLFGMRHPWLPARLRRRGIPRSRFRRFAERMNPWLLRVERLVKPRLAGFTEHLASQLLSGLLLLLLGILLSLPIPLTNYPIGLLILAYAVALIERDGVLLLVAWILGATTTVGFILAGDGALDWARSALG
jgi:hypothetical protein